MDRGIVWNATTSRWEVSFNIVGFGGFFVNTPQTGIAVSLVTPPAFYCADSTVNASYTAIVLTFNLGNTFSLQLSDASGSFTTPITLGTITTIAASGTISGMITWAQAAGIGYRVRVVSSNTAFTGTDNGSNIEIKTTTASSSISFTGGILANPSATGQTNKLITINCDGKQC